MPATHFRDIATGKVARAFSGNFDILANGPNAGTGPKSPCRAIVTTGGAVTITGIDGVNVVLPDMGGPWQWDVQARAIVAGTGIVIY